MENQNHNRNKNANHKQVQKLNQIAGSSAVRTETITKKTTERKRMENKVMKMYVNLAYQELDAD